LGKNSGKKKERLYRGGGKKEIIEKERKLLTVSAFANMPPQIERKEGQKRSEKTRGGTRLKAAYKRARGEKNLRHVFSL